MPDLHWCVSIAALGDLAVPRLVGTPRANRSPAMVSWGGTPRDSLASLYNVRTEQVMAFVFELFADSTYTA
jgi:hypothetical protein